MTTKELSAKFKRIETLFYSGDLTEQEYAHLINHLGLAQALATDAKELQRNQDLYDAMVKAVALVKAIK
jgi:hypothetical protein